MTVIQKYSRRTESGAITSTTGRKRRKFDNGRESFKPTVGKAKCKSVRTLGGNTKEKALGFETANVFITKDKKYKTVKIKNVVENTANVNFVRRNILTKGTVIDTEAGKARITSRPGQENVVNAILIE